MHHLHLACRLRHFTITRRKNDGEDNPPTALNATQKKDCTSELKGISLRLIPLPLLAAHLAICEFTTRKSPCSATKSRYRSINFRSDCMTRISECLCPSCAHLHHASTLVFCSLPCSFYFTLSTRELLIKQCLFRFKIQLMLSYEFLP